MPGGYKTSFYYWKDQADGKSTPACTRCGKEQAFTSVSVPAYYNLHVSLDFPVCMACLVKQVQYLKDMYDAFHN